MAKLFTVYDSQDLNYPNLTKTSVMSESYQTIGGLFNNNSIKKCKSQTQEMIEDFSLDRNNKDGETDFESSANESNTNSQANTENNSKINSSNSNNINYVNSNNNNNKSNIFNNNNDNDNSNINNNSGRAAILIITVKATAVIMIMRMRMKALINFKIQISQTAWEALMTSFQTATLQTSSTI